MAAALAIHVGRYFGILIILMVIFAGADPSVEVVDFFGVPGTIAEALNN